MPMEEITRTNSLRVVVFGRDDPRVRAIWRVLLAMPLLWTLTGAVLAGNTQSAITIIPSGPSQGSGLAQSLLHGGFLLLALGIWSHYLDRYPLSNYGISVSKSWVRDFLVGFLAVAVGQMIWIGISSLLGGTMVSISLSPPENSGLFWLVIPFVALVLHAAVQQIVFFRVVLKNAAEGLHSRGLNAPRAVYGGIPVAVLLFVLMHGTVTPLRALDLVVVGSVFGLCYIHTGELALGIGAHFGALYAGTIVFAVIRVTGSLSGVLGTVGQYGFPKMLFGYLVIVAWLRWRRGTLPVQKAIAQYDPH